MVRNRTRTINKGDTAPTIISEAIRQVGKKFGINYQTLGCYCSKFTEEEKRKEVQPDSKREDNSLVLPSVSHEHEVVTAVSPSLNSPILASIDVDEISTSSNTKSKSDFLEMDNLSQKHKEEEKECFYLICMEPYSNSRPNKTCIQCTKCKWWAHEECTNDEAHSYKYICDNCNSDADMSFKQRITL
ncbi:hypothetical protein PGB90_001516 [Kerria lacca]